MVAKDGTISTIEIVASGGNEYDKEVMRVCRKMPRWKPAIQNGEPATMSYVLPVTFMGLEQ
jgi:protein TonB